MLLELFLVYLLSGGSEPTVREPILVPVASEDLDRCRITLEQVMNGPIIDDDLPGLTLAAEPAREVRCVVQEAED